MKRPYGLGIDAGGTYTDVVLLDFRDGRVVAVNKAPTTQPDPSTGIRQALAGIDAGLLPQVSMASLATTFATNAMVEDRGAEAGLILVGYDEKPPEVPGSARVLMVAGGHTVSGVEKARLDLQGIENKLDTFLSGLEAVAVASFFSVRNPEHELQVAKLVRERYGLPVVCGHSLSMRLDAVKRATTAWWNARLIPLISNLIRATATVLTEKGIDAPFMVVRGDGTLMSARTALDRPVDTLLSGPAASILGARHLAGIEDALIVDMGGTTTDMAVLLGGKVAVDLQGATVGKWKTHVEAAKIRTLGVGGDSLISVNGDRQITVGPRRVVPLCVLADQHPQVLPILRTIQSHMSRAPCRSVVPCSFYVKSAGQENGRSAATSILPDAGPVSEFLLLEGSSGWSSAWELESLEKNGLISRSSLTPTDIRVAAGRFQLGSRQASEMGLAIYAQHVGMDVARFGEAVEEEIRRRLCIEAITYVCNNGDEALSRLVDRWFRQSGFWAEGVGLDIQIKLTAPVVGAGAPAAVCLPAAFRRLHAQCILPEAHQVSVAVGAVVGMVDIMVTGIVRPTESGTYSLHTASGREILSTLDQALIKGRQRLEMLALERMRLNHVVEPLLESEVEEKRIATGTGAEIHLETELRVRATGRPSVRERY
jgi:N-methylhydantoinase A/oxoprolinase/acetone carboxylase beta subunit